MKFLWKGKAHRKTETEAVRFGLRFLYFTAGRENNQLEYLSDDHIATPPTEQGFLEFKESKTRLLHGNKLRQQIVGDHLISSNRNLLCFPLKNLVISGVSAYQILKPYVLSLVFSLTG